MNYTIGYVVNNYNILAEDNDFSKYGIVIHVSFRTGQKAQILDAHTQSGGVCIN